MTDWHIHAFVSVTCKNKFALQTQRGYFLLELNGSKHRVQQVENIININFALALFRTLLNPPPQRYRCWTFYYFHYEAKLCILQIVSGFPKKDTLSLLFFVFFNCSVKILTSVKTFLRIPDTYTHQIVRLSNAQFGLV